MVGEAAQSQAGRNVANTVFDCMLMLGRQYNDDALKAALACWALIADTALAWPTFLLGLAEEPSSSWLFRPVHSCVRDCTAA